MRDRARAASLPSHDRLDRNGSLGRLGRARECTAALFAMAAALTFAQTAHADPIVVDAGWYGFCFAGVFSPATAGCQNEGIGVTGNPITFTTTDNVFLKVTDAFNHGDEFGVYNFATFLGATSEVDTSSGFVTNPDAAFADPLYSHRSYLLGPGSYEINIFALESPFDSGGAYVEVQTVPEPATLALTGVGLVALGALRRRRVVGSRLGC